MVHFASVLLLGFAVPCLTSRSDLSKAPLVNGLVEHLQAAFPGESILAVKKAVADGLARSLGDENIDAREVTCARDYSGLCPQGWSDAGDGRVCIAPSTYQGKCASKQEFGGLTSQQKRQQAARCGALFPCIGACAQNAAAACPFAWRQDANNDCLAPSGYAGPCVGRKNFQSMKQSERQLWAAKCDVVWPCRKASAAAESVQVTVSNSIDADCNQDFGKACPAGFMEEGSSCTAPAGFAGRCGSSVPSTYDASEKAVYAEACKTPWPCLSK